MKMKDVREKARRADLKPGKMNKADLIRAIQAKEGNPTCFATGNDSCDQPECCWRDDCLPLILTSQSRSKKGLFL